MSENLKICPFFMQKKYAEKNGLGVRPLPCVRDEHGEIKEQTLKQSFAKIDEELNELKSIALVGKGLDSRLDEEMIDDTERDVRRWIAEEAADVKTAITTLEEALGIDAAMRSQAQLGVNHKNFSRGRL